MNKYKGFSGCLWGILVLLTSFVHAQGLYQVSTDEKTSRSSLIVEGKVIDKTSYWNPQHTMIYTSNKTEVYKVFKGSLQKNTINIITVGGTVNGYCILASHQLRLDKGDLGVFYCQPNAAQALLSNEASYDVYSSSQGFLKYDLFKKTAAAPFVQYDNIEQGLYNDLYKKTGRKAVIKNASFSVEEAHKAVAPGVGNNSTLAPVINTFSPATVEGGAFLDPDNNILTINGSGFGDSPSGSSAVLFADADKSAGNFTEVTYDNSLIISWANTQIKLRVPSQAGTGVFQVRIDDGTTASSPSSLNVIFTVLSGYFGDDYGYKQFNLANANGNGGYSIKYSTSTANNGVNINTSEAKATFERAMNTWKETVGANIVEAGTTTLQKVDVNDGTNVVMFDNGGTTLGSPLAAGILATCFSGAGICNDNPSQDQALKTGFDIVVRNIGFSTGTVNFTFGPCSPHTSEVPQVDLETVLLHELGHALNLGHIIDPAEVSGGLANPARLMHFSVSYNHRRISLDYAAKIGALYEITPHGHTYGSCVPSNAEMVPLPVIAESKDECPSNFPSTITPLLTTVSFDLAHATSNKFVDPSLIQLTNDGKSTSITNTAFYALKTNNLGGELSLEIKNYVTQPAELASCTPSSSGIPVTGVQLALYEVPSCPAGESFPTPFFYTTFQANGVIPDISGLKSNTTYLIVLDGIENTKATFDMVLSGSALTLRFNDFTGAISGNSNLLSWKTDNYDVSSMFLERSGDGVNFEEITEISPASEQEEGNYSDLKFLPGDNYYRLAVHTTDGSVQYSPIVMLARSETFLLRVYPNPIPKSTLLNIEVLSETPGNYSLALYNSMGQLVLKREITVSSNGYKTELPVSKLPAGVYYLNIIGPNGKHIQSAAVIRN